MNYHTRPRTTVRSLDIVGQHEIVQRTGANKGTVSMWLTRSPANGFPAPVLTLGCGRLFLWSEVEAWHLARSTPKQ